MTKPNLPQSPAREHLQQHLEIARQRIRGVISDLAAGAEALTLPVAEGKEADRHAFEADAALAFAGLACDLSRHAATARVLSEVLARLDGEVQS